MASLSRHWILIQFYTQLASYTLGNPQITSLSTLPHQCLFQVAELSGTFEDSPRHVLLHLLQSSTAIGHTGTRHCTGCTQLTGNRELVEVGRGRVGVEALVSPVDSLEFHWRTLVPFALELYFSSAGVPLENLSSTGAPGDAPGHGQAVPQPGACPGHQTHG